MRISVKSKRDFDFGEDRPASVTPTPITFKLNNNKQIRPTIQTIQTNKHKREREREEITTNIGC